MKGKHLKEHIDLIRAVLSSIVLVSGAVGSLVNILCGHSLPTFLSGVVVLLILVFIFTEFKDRRERHREEKAILRELDAAHRQITSTPMPYPIEVSDNRAMPLDRIYVRPDGQWVLRILAPRTREGSP